MARKKYGTTAWGAWFLDMLASYDGDGRLNRGKSYANTGKVDSVHISGRRVAARVAGHYDPWYHVVITFPKLPQKTAKKITAIFEKNPIALEALRSGIMQPELIEEYREKDIRLIPAKWTAISRKCSCPDSGDPCKHEAAVLFILAREIDFDPRLLFQLAGYDINTAIQRESLHKDFAKTETSQLSDNTNTAAQSEQNRQTDTAAATLEIEDPIPAKLRNKKTVQELLENTVASDAENNAETMPPVKNKVLSFPSAESYIPLVTGFLPDNPAFSVSNFVPKLTEFYHTVLTAYDSSFYSLDEQYDNPHPFYAHITISTKALSKKKDTFPLSKTSLLTMKIHFSKKSFTECTLLQAGVLFAAKPLETAVLSEDYCIAYSFYQLAKKIIRDSAFIPAVNVSDNRLSVFWKPLIASTEIAVAVDEFASVLSPSFFPPISKWGKRYCAELLLTAYLTEYVTALHFRPRLSSHPDREIDELFFSNYEIDTRVPGNKNLATVIYTWLSVLNYQQDEYVYRLTVKIKDTETIMLSAEVAKSDDIHARFISLPVAVKKEKDASRILKFPIALASYMPQIAELASKKSIALNFNAAGTFLQDSAKLLERFGVEIVLPKALQKTLRIQSVLSVNTKNKSAAVQSFLKLTDLLAYDHKIMLGDFEISYKEFQKLVKENTKLIKFNDKYVLLDPEEVAQLFFNYEHAEELTSMEVIQSVLSGQAAVTPDAQRQIDSIFKTENLSVPKALKAQLRRYQHEGFSWMYTNIKSGFGCLLADDMGLGKTIQIITLILKLKETGALIKGILIVVPASVIANWKHEIQKFAPALRCNIYHGAGRKLDNKKDVTLTTYHTMQKDIEKIIAADFLGTIIDEAQNIKNTQSKSAQALKKLQTDFRIALTGTPVENNLEDMRAIFDFILPRYFGDAKTFRQKWRIPIELHGNIECSEAFKKISTPFVLRRVKTDKNIISDLPDKIIANNYCNLTGRQVALYEALVASQLGNAMKANTQIKRTALILKMLTGLKQICNHPNAFDKTSPQTANLSGKVSSLLFLLKEILENGEKVLIFSQYVETLTILKKVIEDELDITTLSITGRMKPEKRQQNVDQFQTDPSERILLISLKAGGTGLNLTAASRVIHFDLWYNPAVEDQATDRAFRIGQQKTVFVHRLICEGTFEEKIDAMIQKKRGIADAVSGGETWISHLSNEELTEILRLEK